LLTDFSSVCALGGLKEENTGVGMRWYSFNSPITTNCHKQAYFSSLPVPLSHAMGVCSMQWEFPSARGFNPSAFTNFKASRLSRSLLLTV